MYNTFIALGFAAVIALITTSASAGSPDFNQSLYVCSEYSSNIVVKGGNTDNCIADPEARADLVNTWDGDDGGEAGGNEGDDDDED